MIIGLVSNAGATQELRGKIKEPLPLPRPARVHPCFTPSGRSLFGEEKLFLQFFTPASTIQHFPRRVGVLSPHPRLLALPAL